MVGRTVASEVAQRRAAGEVAVEHHLRLDNLRVLSSRRVEPVGQVVGLGGVEHPVVPQHGYLLHSDFAGVRTAVGNLDRLPEDDDGGVLPLADLAAKLGDLPVGPPVPRAEVFLGSGQAEEEHVHAPVRLTGGHRRGPPIRSLPGFVPGNRAAL
jgi:hypothetical protein